MMMTMMMMMMMPIHILLNISNLYADADARSMTPSRNTRSYTLQVPGPLKPRSAVFGNILKFLMHPLMSLKAFSNSQILKFANSQILDASPDVFQSLLKEWKILGGVHLSQGKTSNSFQTWGKGKRKGNKRICLYLSWKIGKNSSTTKGVGFQVIIKGTLMYLYAGTKLSLL